MKGRTGSLETAVLKTRWRRWLKIVELFASERPARRRVDPEAYGMLQKELVTTCRSLAAAANEVDGAFYRYLEDLVQPWLSPLVLARADREIICDLLLRCRQVERALAGHSWSPRLPLLVLLTVSVSFFVFRWVLERGISANSASPVFLGLRSVLDDVRFAIARSSDFERLSFVAVVLVAISIITVSRTARS